MARPLISQYLPPDIDPTKASIAYGRRALPKLKEELQSPDLLTRQRALMALCDLVHDPEYVYEAISIGFLNSLKVLLKDPDNTVRQKTIEVFSIMANHSVGRQGFLKNQVIVALFQILDDQVLLCRRFLHETFRSVAQVPQGKYAALDAGAIPFLLELLAVDVVKVRLNAIKALTMLAEAPEGRQDLLKEVDRFKVLIHSPVLVVSRAAQIATKVIEWKP